MRLLARECGGRWVRSSSCVEGRNGVLRLGHHGRGGLSERALAALTVLHNYWIGRGDGTTAAGRFFGREPEDLFDWLLQRFPELPRPARRPPDHPRARSNRGSRRSCHFRGRVIGRGIRLRVEERWPCATWPSPE